MNATLISFLVFAFSVVGIFSEASAMLRTKLLNKMEVLPGQKIRDHLTLYNDQEQPVAVELKQVDYSFNCLGETHFLPVETLKFSNAGWVSLSSKWVNLAPGTTVDVPYTITVPDDPKLKGSYSSMILVEPQSPVGFLSSNEVDHHVQVAVKVRYAHLIVTTLGDSKCQLKVLDKHIIELGEKTMLAMDIENVGSQFIRPKIYVNLFDHTGQLVKDVLTLEQNLLPNTSIRYVIDVGELEQGSYKGLMYISDDREYFMVDQVDFTTEKS